MSTNADPKDAGTRTEFRAADLRRTPVAIATTACADWIATVQRRPAASRPDMAAAADGANSWLAALRGRKFLPGAQQRRQLTWPGFFESSLDTSGHSDLITTGERVLLEANRLHGNRQVLAEQSPDQASKERQIAENNAEEQLAERAKEVAAILISLKAEQKAIEGLQKIAAACCRASDEIYRYEVKRSTRDEYFNSVGKQAKKLRFRRFPTPPSLDRAEFLKASKQLSSCVSQIQQNIGLVYVFGTTDTDEQTADSKLSKGKSNKERLQASVRKQAESERFSAAVMKACDYLDARAVDLAQEAEAVQVQNDYSVPLRTRAVRRTSHFFERSKLVPSVVFLALLLLGVIGVSNRGDTGEARAFMTFSGWIVSLFVAGAVGLVVVLMQHRSGDDHRRSQMLVALVIAVVAAIFLALINLVVVLRVARFESERSLGRRSGNSAPALTVDRPLTQQSSGDPYALGPGPQAGEGWVK